MDLNFSLLAGRHRHHLLGGLAICFYAIHGGYYLLNAYPWGLLWCCHLAAVLVGMGLILQWPTLNAIGFLWLCIGNSLWVLDLATGGEFIRTSTFTHIGGFLIGIYGIRTLGMPGSVWYKALFSFFILQLLSRWVTPAPENINVAFAVWGGWESSFSSYFWYMALLYGLFALVFWGLERSLQRWSPPLGMGS
ncbi:MAG: hypothetical protein V3W14_12340 [Candidatus Neomarinimicrobiota bacterium]